MTQSTKPRIIPIFLGHTQDRVDVVEAQLARFAGEGRPVQVAFYGASFLSLGVDERQHLLRELEPLVSSQRIAGIRVTTDPSDVLPDSAAELRSGGVTVVELNVCSMNDEVLDFARRRHSSADVRRSIEILKASGLRVGVRIHPGLPGSSDREIFETGRAIAALRPDFVRIYPVLVLAGTDLEHAWRESRYRPLSLQEAVTACRHLVDLFNAANIPVVRVGLQPAVDLAEGGEVVAGPYHPALRALVDAERLFDRASRLVEAEFRFAREIALHVSPREESALRGPHGDNVVRLKDRFKLRELRVIADEDIALGALRLTILPPPPEPPSVEPKIQSA